MNRWPGGGSPPILMYNFNNKKTLLGAALLPSAGGTKKSLSCSQDDYFGAASCNQSDCLKRGFKSGFHGCGGQPTAPTLSRFFIIPIYLVFCKILALLVQPTISSTFMFTLQISRKNLYKLHINHVNLMYFFEHLNRRKEGIWVKLVTYKVLLQFKICPNAHCVVFLPNLISQNFKSYKKYF